MPDDCLTRRAYFVASHASSWEEIWEAGPYYERVSQILETARDQVFFAGWQIDSRLPLPRPGLRAEPLKEKILRLVHERPQLNIYFLMWDHAYFYSLEREYWQGRIWDRIHPRVHFVFDNRHPFGASHHEKICLIDGQVAFCGGIDLCDERWDSPQHLYEDPRRSLDGYREHHGPYHDLAVQVTGPICGEIEKHTIARWRKISSIPIQSTPQRSFLRESHRVLLSRTLAPDPKVGMIREVEFLFRDLIQSAQKRIILEGQYYWSRTLNDLLIAQMMKRSHSDFELTLIFTQLNNLRSLTRRMASYETELQSQIRAVARLTQTRLTLAFPSVITRFPPRPIYIHSKLLLIDDRYLSVGSANFSSRALRVDTELNLTLEARSQADRIHIARVARTVLEHWNRCDIRLAPLAPFLTPDCKRRKNFPWQLFFDPDVPWFYFFTKKLGRMRRHTWNERFFFRGLLWIGAVLASAASARHLVWGWEFLYCSVLASSWILPIPLIPVALLATLHLGLHASMRIVWGSVILAGLFGYGYFRAFSQPFKSPFKDILRRREFSSLILILLDPRPSFRETLLLQGTTFTPFAWFAFSTLILLPSWIGGVCWVANFLVPAAQKEWIQQRPGLVLILILALLWKKNP